MSATSEFSASGKEHNEPEDLERASDEIRADLDDTLKALERKFSPKQLLDRSLSYVQANGGQLLQEIGATVRTNPLPLLVTSAGVIWLLASSRSSARTTVSSWTGSQDLDASGTGSSRLQATGARLKRTATKSLDMTRQRTADLGHNVGSFIEQQPLICGAIAIAVGAVIGAAFPATPYERDLVERARSGGDSLVKTVKSPLESADPALNSSPLSH